ncbi:MAG: large-conductance mechanosensitive channel protein MscL [Phycisphaerales bacterium]|nr:large-conductance mechanosensitive channel protein MscL [Planctomycetota bacterium]MCH8509624.1 large-conductance mechanosensitive channel protein MscL [Phycisphaerales bacterium]
MGFGKEFRDFAMRGNVVDMAIGIVIGAAFGTIVRTLVDKVIMPPVGVLTGGVDFNELKIEIKEGIPATDAAPEVAPVYIFYGEFINSVITFVIIALVLFVVIKMMNNARKRFEKEQEAPAATPPPTTEDILLLREIRDALKIR